MALLGVLRLLKQWRQEIKNLIEDEIKRSECTYITQGAVDNRRAYNEEIATAIPSHIRLPAPPRIPKRKQPGRHDPPTLSRSGLGSE